LAHPVATALVPDPVAAMAEIGKPAQMEMGASIVDDEFGPHNALLVKQTMRGCLQECMGCEAKSEFTIAPLDPSHVNGFSLSEQALNTPDIMYALEESSCCCRLCWRDGRPFDMILSKGGQKGGETIVNFKKPCSFPLIMQVGDSQFPCCCFLPKLEPTTAAGVPLGSESAYVCDMFLYVPKLHYREGGQTVYVLKPETCCGGCCIACNPCSGKGALFIPFYFHDPTTMEVVGGAYNDANTPQIRKVWAGFKKECCSTADTFTLIFPSGIDNKRKAGLLGLTFLLDFTVFERQNEGK